MKKQGKNLVLTGVLLLAITGLLALAGCKNDSVNEAASGAGTQQPSSDTETNGEATYQFTETVQDVDPSYTGTMSGGRYVKFGDWPQTILKGDVTVDENKSKEMGMFTCYLGSDGNYYVKEGGSYFKVEPIVWRVLTDNYNSTGKALLLAESILTGGIPYYYYVDDNDKTRTITGAGTNEGEPDTVYANNWRYSTIRAWQNGSYEANDTQDTTYDDKGFLQTAFTESAQKLIAKTTVDNSEGSTFGTGETSQTNSYACANTTDKVFLLSQEEATDSGYGFAAYNQYGQGSTRIRVTTDYAEATGAFQSTDAGNGGRWWLRSPNYVIDLFISFARVILDDGDADNYRNNVRSSDGGVVPALCVQLD